MITQSDSEGPDFTQTVTPKNDLTNLGAFISIGTIDNVLQVNRKSFVKELHMDLSVDSIINYPQSFNSFRDTARLYDSMKRMRYYAATISFIISSNSNSIYLKMKQPTVLVLNKKIWKASIICKIWQRN